MKSAFAHYESRPPACRTDACLRHLEAAMAEAVAMIREGHHAHIEDGKGEIVAGPEAIKKQFGMS